MAPVEFAHPVEQAVADVLDELGISWQYEPHTFTLEEDENGNVSTAFTPDFYLPEIDAYIECTVMRQSGTTKKNHKVRLAQELHGVVITILYKRDLRRLGLWSHARVQRADTGVIAAAGFCFQLRDESAVACHNGDTTCGGRPHAEVNAPRLAELGADRQAPRPVRRLHRREQQQKGGQRLRATTSKTSTRNRTIKDRLTQ